MGQKKQNLGSPARSRFFPKWTFSVFWLFLYQFWLWSTVESTWMVNLTSYVSSGIHINAKQTPGAPLGGPTRLDFPRFWLIFWPFLTRVTWSTYYMYHNTTDMSCEAPGAHPPSPHFPCSTPLPLSQKVDFSVHVLHILSYIMLPSNLSSPIMNGVEKILVSVETESV